MPNKVVETKYPLIDADPHVSRVIGYFRPSDYAFWTGSTIAFPGLLYAWGVFNWSAPCHAAAKTVSQKWRTQLILK